MAALKMDIPYVDTWNYVLRSPPRIQGRYFHFDCIDRNSNASQDSRNDSQLSHNDCIEMESLCKKITQSLVETNQKRILQQDVNQNMNSLIVTPKKETMINTTHQPYAAIEPLPLISKLAKKQRSSTNKIFVLGSPNIHYVHQKRGLINNDLEYTGTEKLMRLNIPLGNLAKLRETNNLNNFRGKKDVIAKAVTGDLIYSKPMHIARQPGIYKNYYPTAASIRKANNKIKSEHYSCSRASKVKNKPKAVPRKCLSIKTSSSCQKTSVRNLDKRIIPKSIINSKPTSNINKKALSADETECSSSIKTCSGITNNSSKLFVTGIHQPPKNTKGASQTNSIQSKENNNVMNVQVDKSAMAISKNSTADEDTILLVNSCVSKVKKDLILSLLSSTKQNNVNIAPSLALNTQMLETKNILNFAKPKTDTVTNVWDSLTKVWTDTDVESLDLMSPTSNLYGTDLCKDSFSIKRPMCKNYEVVHDSTFQNQFSTKLSRSLTRDCQGLLSPHRDITPIIEDEGNYSWAESNILISQRCHSSLNVNTSRNFSCLSDDDMKSNNSYDPPDLIQEYKLSDDDINRIHTNSRHSNNSEILLIGTPDPPTEVEKSLCFEVNYDSQCETHINICISPLSDEKENSLSSLKFNNDIFDINVPNRMHIMQDISKGPYWSALKETTNIASSDGDSERNAIRDPITVIMSEVTNRETINGQNNAHEVILFTEDSYPPAELNAIEKHALTAQQNPEVVTVQGDKLEKSETTNQLVTTSNICGQIGDNNTKNDIQPNSLKLDCDEGPPAINTSLVFGNNKISKSVSSLTKSMSLEYNKLEEVSLKVNVSDAIQSTTSVGKSCSLINIPEDKLYQLRTILQDRKSSETITAEFEGTLQSSLHAISEPRSKSDMCEIIKTLEDYSSCTTIWKESKANVNDLKNIEEEDLESLFDQSSEDFDVTSSLYDPEASFNSSQRTLTNIDINEKVMGSSKALNNKGVFRQIKHTSNRIQEPQMNYYMQKRNKSILLVPASQLRTTLGSSESSSTPTNSFEKNIVSDLQNDAKSVKIDNSNYEYIPVSNSYVTTASSNTLSENLGNGESYSYLNNEATEKPNSKSISNKNPKCVSSKLRRKRSMSCQQRSSSVVKINQTSLYNVREEKLKNVLDIRCGRKIWREDIISGSESNDSTDESIDSLEEINKELRHIKKYTFTQIRQETNCIKASFMEQSQKERLDCTNSAFQGHAKQYKRQHQRSKSEQVSEKLIQPVKLTSNSPNNANDICRPQHQRSKSIPYQKEAKENIAKIVKCSNLHGKIMTKLPQPTKPSIAINKFRTYAHQRSKSIPYNTSNHRGFNNNTTNASCPSEKFVTKLPQPIKNNNIFKTITNRQPVCFRDTVSQNCENRIFPYDLVKPVKRLVLT